MRYNTGPPQRSGSLQFSKRGGSAPEAVRPIDIIRNILFNNSPYAKTGNLTTDYADEYGFVPSVQR